jgi:phosphatidylglycerol---prolipoprotein diacylglyceryl transferase
MVPVLRFGSVAVPTHDAFVLLGVAAATLLFVIEARRRQVRDPRIWWVVMGALVGGAVVAKASTAWRYLASDPDPSVAGVLLYGGKSVLGGLAGAYVGAIATKRIVAYRSSTGDLFAPAVALGLAIGRVGCFLTEQVGTPTSMPWGISVSSEVAARIPMCPTCVAGTPMHPSFLYEIAFHLAALGVLLWLRLRLRVPGELFKIYLLGYAVFRFAVEFVRANPPMWGGLSGSQLFLIPGIGLLVAYFWRQLSRGAYVQVARA